MILNSLQDQLMHGNPQAEQKSFDSIVDNDAFSKSSTEFTVDMLGRIATIITKINKQNKDKKENQHSENLEEVDVDIIMSFCQKQKAIFTEKNKQFKAEPSKNKQSNKNYEKDLIDFMSDEEENKK